MNGATAADFRPFGSQEALNAYAAYECGPEHPASAAATIRAEVHGNARSPYVRRTSAMMRMAQIDAELAERVEAKRALRETIRKCEEEIERADTLRSTDEQAPSREIEVYGEL